MHVATLTRDDPTHVATLTRDDAMLDPQRTTLRVRVSETDLTAVTL